jgi:hypothetical protein
VCDVIDKEDSSSSNGRVNARKAPKSAPDPNDMNNQLLGLVAMMAAIWVASTFL